MLKRRYKEGIDKEKYVEELLIGLIIEAVKKELYQFPFLLENTKLLENYQGKYQWEPVLFGSKIFACLNSFFIQQTETICQWWKLRGSQHLQGLKPTASLKDILELLPLFLARNLQLHLQETDRKAVVFINNYEYLSDEEGKYNWLKDLSKLNHAIFWIILAEKPVGCHYWSTLFHKVVKSPVVELNSEEFPLHPIVGEYLYHNQPSDLQQSVNDWLFEYYQKEYRQEQLQLTVLVKLLEHSLRSQQQQQVIDWFLEQITLQQQVLRHQFTVFMLQLLLKCQRNPLAFTLLGKSLFVLGDYQQAIIALQTAQKLWATQTGAENLALATVELFLGACYLKLQRTSEAHSAANKALRIRTSQLSENSVEVAEVLNIKVEIAIFEGYYSEALKLSQQVLQIFESHQNIQFLQLAQTKFTIGWLNAREKNFDLALKQFRQTLDILNLVDKTHPLAISCHEMLGNIYQKMGYFTYRQAYKEYKIALENAEINPCVTHTKTLQLITAIVNLSRIRGEYDTVDFLVQRRHANMEISHFKETAAVADRLNKLGYLFYQQAQYAFSENLLQQALQINCKVLSKQHPQTAESFHNLGLIYKNQRRYYTAEVYFKQALQIRSQILGEQHPTTANSLNSLAALYCCMGKYQQAEPLLQQALEICQNSFGEMHPHTATTLNNLAQMYQCLGLNAKAEPIFRQALDICLSVLGEEHHYTLTVESNFNRLQDNS